MSSDAKRLPKIGRPAPGVYLLTSPVQIARALPPTEVILPIGHEVAVTWASKRWAECTAVYNDIILGPIPVSFRIPPHVLEAKS
jgi:hypothetical protein